MTSTAQNAAAPFLYVEVDVPDGQTLVEWRRTHNPYLVNRPVRRALRRVTGRTHRAH
jgi:hypothetical protein